MWRPRKDSCAGYEHPYRIFALWYLLELLLNGKHLLTGRTHLRQFPQLEDRILNLRYNIALYKLPDYACLRDNALIRLDNI